MFKGEDEAKKEKLYLDKKPIAFQRAIVCRGTTCYRAQRQNSKRLEFVVKFSWRSDKRRAEGELLRLAKERKVWGIAQLFGHQDLESIADLRKGMVLASPRTFKSATESSFSENQSRTGSLSSGLGISRHSQLSSSRQKRKRHGETSSTQAKRSRSDSSRRRLDFTGLIKEDDDRSEEVTKHSVEQPITTGPMSLARTMEYYDNRIFSCLVISPPGRPIYEFESVKEFLDACRDIIRAHKSLYLDGKILHRDISENNLIITDAKGEGEPRGMLIDLDLAKELGSRSTGAMHRTGTMEFMAIEVLNGTAHTYRHDLESFFYVFLWVIILGKRRILRQTSPLRDWYKGHYMQIANSKRGYMDRGAFQYILAEFPVEFQSVKALAQELRDILFPLHRGALFTGTYEDPDKLCKPMIDAFNLATLL